MNWLSCYCNNVIFIFSWIDWTQCRTNFAEFVKSLQQGSILEHSLAKDVNHFLVEHPTTRLSFQNAKTIIDVLLTKRIELHVRHVVLENA